MGAVLLTPLTDLVVLFEAQALAPWNHVYVYLVWEVPSSGESIYL
jgi:hypothetical protein